MSYKKRKYENDDDHVLQAQLFHLSKQQDAMIQMLQQTQYQIQQIYAHTQPLEYRIQRLESNLEKLTKEISDLQIHALHFNGKVSEPPYQHF